MRHRIIASQTAHVWWRVLAGGGAVTFTSRSFYREGEVETRRNVDRRCTRKTCLKDSSVHQSWVDRMLSASSDLLRFSRLPPTLMEASANKAAIPTRRTASSERQYDFVVIGNGNSGRTAVETLQTKCPGARIALIDPLLRKSNKSLKKLDYFATFCTALNPQQRTVELNDGTRLLKYKHAVLVATGAHGAPPPLYLLDEKARNRILELRPSILPTSLSDQTRPILPPEQVRTNAIKMARNGGRVAVLGSGWDAVDLAVATSSLVVGRSKGGAAAAQRPVMIFGKPGPASHMVPSYLSSAIAKRLRSKKIDVLDRTLIRYITRDEHSDDDGKRLGQLQLYSAKSYDFLDGQRTTVDLVVVAPEVSGIRGNAVQPTNNIPNHLVNSSNGRPWYQTWSKLTMSSVNDPSMVACYKEDGRIVVNTELLVCTGVYAAGSVAKLANALSGHANVAGVGVEDGADAGRIAAANMARQYHNNSSLFPFQDGLTESFVKDPLPVWRSDLLSYADGTHNKNSCLSEIGVTALAVGHCDSERFMTHAVWWTNQSAQRRLIKLFNDEDTSKKERRQRLKDTLKSVYGIGVIFYMDRTGRIEGIMTWGIPFSDQHNRLNQQLVQHTKSIIKTNGGFGSLDTEQDHVRMSKFLEDETRRLVSMAFAESNNNDDIAGETHQLDGALDSFPRPLHRFTDVRPASVRSAGVLKRKDGHGQGILGEDLFARYEHTVPNVAPARPMAGVGFASTDSPLKSKLNKKHTTYQEAKNMYEWTVYEQKEKQFEENEALGRPAREDPLWIRKGDELRNIAHKDTVAAAYSAAIMSGRS